MAATSTLQIDDFKSIGLRPMEFRPAVIRKAVAKSALPLATLHLTHPSTVVERKLARLVATGYRLLDPRCRDDSIQRMMLGRIHPQLADEAVRIAQTRGNQQTTIETTMGFGTGEFVGNGLLPKTVARSRRQTKHPVIDGYFATQPIDGWGDTLQSHDLLVDRPLRRLLWNARSLFAQRPVAVAAAIAFVSVSLASWRLTRDALPPVLNDPAPLVASVLPTPGTTLLPPRPTVTLPPTPRVTPRVTLDEPAISKQSEPIESIAKPLPDTPPQALSRAVSPVALISEMIGRETDFADELRPSLSMPLVPISSDVEPIVLSVNEPLAQADDKPTKVIRSFVDELAVARRTLAAEIAAIDKTDWPQIETKTTRWTVLWLQQAIVAGELDAAELLAGELDALAKRSGDASRLAWLAQTKGTLDAMRRLHQTAEDVDQTTDTPAPRDRYAAGRYWALVRRDWVRALPHLAAGSDPRSANLANIELLIGGISATADLVQLAKGYTALADKSKGWMRDSYCLHLIELLKTNQGKSTDSESLELAKILSDLEREHAALIAEPVIKPKAIIAMAPSTSGEPGLVGRLSMQGRDAGLLIHYEPGTPLTPAAVHQVTSSLESNSGAMSLDLVGVIHLERPTAVSFHAATAASQSLAIGDKPLLPAAHVHLSSSDVVYRADLAAGNWTVRWTVALGGSDSVSLEVFDALSASVVPVWNPPANDADHPANFPTTRRVRVIAAR